MIGHARRVAILAALTVSVGLAVDATGDAAITPPHRFPAAGELLRPAVVRAAPDPSARAMRTMRRFRPDLQFQIVLALSARRGPTAPGGTG